MPTQYDFSDKTVLITGGGGGIGRATALAFAAAGAKLAIADINTKAAEETVKQIHAMGGGAIYIQADVTDEAQVNGMIKTVIDNYGRLDCAFNNAGIEGGFNDSLIDHSAEVFDQIMAVNVRGVFLCMKAEIPQMISQGGGVIVNTASIAGLVGSVGLSVYSASKHAVNGLTKSAALEYAEHGVRVNSVCPAIIQTPMVERAVAANPKLGDILPRWHPMKRIGLPEEVAAAVLWLCAEDAAFVTGHTLAVDGGYTAR